MGWQNFPSWLKGGLVALIISFFFLIFDIVGVLSADLFGGLGAFALAHIASYYIIFIILSFPLGAIAGFLIGKLKIKTEEGDLSLVIYLSLSILILIAFFYLYEKSFIYFTTIFIKLFYLPFLILFVILTLEYFNSSIKITSIAVFIIAILLFSLTFTSIPCKTTNQFCKEEYCSSGFDRLSGKCTSEVEYCTIGFPSDRHKDCENNDNGRVLCDFRLEKCVENVVNCVMDDYCSQNTNGKTFCHVNNSVCVEPENKFSPRIVDDYGPGWFIVEGQRYES